MKFIKLLPSVLAFLFIAASPFVAKAAEPFYGAPNAAVAYSFMWSDGTHFDLTSKVFVADSDYWYYEDGTGVYGGALGSIWYFGTKPADAPYFNAGIMLDLGNDLKDVDIYLMDFQTQTTGTVVLYHYADWDAIPVKTETGTFKVTSPDGAIPIFDVNPNRILGDFSNLPWQPQSASVAAGAAAHIPFGFSVGQDDGIMDPIVELHRADGTLVATITPTKGQQLATYDAPRLQGWPDGVGEHVDLYHYSGAIDLAAVATSDAGDYYLMARNGHAFRKSKTFTLTVTSPDGVAPVIRDQPSGANLNLGDRVLLKVSANGTPGLTFKWRKDGIMVGTNQPYFEIHSAQKTDAGQYTVEVSNSIGSVVSEVASVGIRPEGGQIILPTDSTARLMNISARALVKGGANIIIGGLVVAEAPVKVLVRAGGPSLKKLGVTNPLVDPKVTGYQEGVEFASNDNWGDGDPSLAEVSSGVGATPYDGITSKDAAMPLTLNPGAYTFHITGADGGSGVALLEIYLVDDPDLHGSLVNLSTRAFVGTGENILIGGLVVEGPTTGSILVRGVGPSLTGQGVTSPLADPKLAIFHLADQIGSADNWGTDYLPYEMSALYKKLGAFDLPADSTDAARYLQLPTGGYTFQVSGRSDGTGVALIESYLVRPDPKLFP